MKSILQRSRKSELSTQPLGVYCHVPFCASTCDFCAFYQDKPRRGDLNRYLDAMDLEFSRLPMGREVSTIFWGGGTPSLLSAKELERIGQSLLSRLPCSPQEWTVEMAPSTIKADKLSVLRDLGVTRVLKVHFCKVNREKCRYLNFDSFLLQNPIVTLNHAIMSKASLMAVWSQKCEGMEGV